MWYNVLVWTTHCIKIQNLKPEHALCYQSGKVQLHNIYLLPILHLPPFFWAHSIRMLLKKNCKTSLLTRKNDKCYLYLSFQYEMKCNTFFLIIFIYSKFFLFIFNIHKFILSIFTHIYNIILLRIY